MFMDRNDILNLYVVTTLPLPAGALPHEPTRGVPIRQNGLSSDA
jgi:hypothetical protein